MNLVALPYHDWRKINREGFRTRDAHLIEHFIVQEKVKNLIVINRPTTRTELFIKNQCQKFEGKVLLRKGNYRLYQVKPNFFVIDFIINEDIILFFERSNWFFRAFNKTSVLEFVQECLDFLRIPDFRLISNNIYASNLCEKISKKKYIFDAYDNLLLFPHLKSFQKKLRSAYDQYFNSENSIIVTNSQTNIDFFSKEFASRDIYLLTNGVDIQRFRGLRVEDEIPDDLKPILKPIIGFGGKISHLIDVSLFEYVIKDNLDKNFVLLGQVLNKTILKRLLKYPNLTYLGDKVYSQYHKYVKYFDLAIIPYVTGEKETGANTIKVYEYIAAGLHVIGTDGCGLGSLNDFVSIANSKEEFSFLIKKFFSSKKEFKQKDLPEQYTWKFISNEFLNILARN